MAKPHIHAASSARRWGGDAKEYEHIHSFMDSSKGAIADNRHRALTHNAWFISTVIEAVFGTTFVNSVGRTVSTRGVAEQHVLEDYGMKFIPSAQDFLEEIEFKPWMQNGVGLPPSCKKLKKDEVQIGD